MTKKQLTISKDELIKSWLIEDFLHFVVFYYEKQHMSKFIVNDHHRVITSALMDVVLGKTKNLIINIAPRYSKTELVSIMFPCYCYALNPSCNFIETSYSSDLTEKNSLAIKDIIKSPEFTQYFEARIKNGEDTKSAWGTEQNGKFYATSTLGQLTGFGSGATNEIDENGVYHFSGAIVIDDPIKPVDALSETKRDAINEWFFNTLKSRVNSPKSTPIIIIMQRLHEKDLCGFVTEKEKDTWKVIKMPCLTFDEEGNAKALWEFKHSVDDLRAIESASSFVFETQYQQNPKPLEGLLYEHDFKTYEEIPITRKHIRKNYTDTADTGSDFLCSIDYIETEIGNYILDVIYTQKSMETTEPLTAKILTIDNIDECVIESNNGGRSFGRAVEQQTRINGNNKTRFRFISQTKNKEVRLFTRSIEVLNLTYFPTDWKTRWSQFAHDITSHQKSGKNTHDDAPDALTGTIEMRSTKSVNNVANFF